MADVDIATQLRALVAYNERANTIVLDALGGLSDEQLDARCGASQESMRSTMQHVVWAQNVWLGRCGVPVAANEGDMRAGFTASNAALRTFVESRTVADFAANIDYTDSHGTPFSIPLWQLVTHVCNHGTHHRAECGLLLGQLDRSPGDIDFVYFMLGRI